MRAFLDFVSCTIRGTEATAVLSCIGPIAFRFKHTELSVDNSGECATINYSENGSVRLLRSPLLPLSVQVIADCGA